MSQSPPVSMPVLIVDDEDYALEAESLCLTLNGFTDVRTCVDSARALDLIAERPPGILILDITMPHMSGIAILDIVRERFPSTNVIMLTGLNDAETAVDCLKRGAYDYIVKPIDQMRLVTTVRRAVEHRSMQEESERLAESVLESTVRTPVHFKDIITANPRMVNIFKYIEALAPTPLPIFITGETGVGKELFARAVHRSSGRAGEFVCFNSAGIDDSLFGDTLFGHVKGAFTGAHRDAAGLIGRAENGTLFIDEIGDMRPETQVKLLRLLQERTYYRLGSEVELSSTARIVAATNKTLDELQKNPGFRKDLFYRLKSHHVHVPPLRERRGDVRLLASHFIEKASADQAKSCPAAPPELFVILENYDYPGNVRELQGIINDAVGRSNGGTLSCEPVKLALGIAGRDAPITPRAPSLRIEFPTPLPTADEMERSLIVEALARTNGNKKLAAELIGMSRQTFRNKLLGYGQIGVEGSREQRSQD